MTRSIRYAALFPILAASPLTRGQMTSWQPDITVQQNYTLHRASSTDPTAGNADYRTVAPGGTINVSDVDGPATISHIWFTIADDEPYHLKRVVLRNVTGVAPLSFAHAAMVIGSPLRASIA
jgi:hypothetical protein